MTRQTSSRTIKTVLGVAFAAIGLLLLLINLDNVTASLDHPAGATAESLNAFVELGLAGMHAAHAYFFDHASFQSGLQQILVSFWPLILVILGTALLWNAVSDRLSGARLRPQGNGVRE